MANAAWLALAVMAHNLARAVGQLAGGRLHRATAATLRRAVFTVPGRLVHIGRRLRLRLPAELALGRRSSPPPWTTITAIPHPPLNNPPPRTTATEDLGQAGRPAAHRCAGTKPRSRRSTQNHLDQFRATRWIRAKQRKLQMLQLWHRQRGAAGRRLEDRRPAMAGAHYSLRS